MSDPATEGFYTTAVDAEDFDRYTGQEVCDG